jgi:formylglycine-generating enzyme required for sulfatase activity
MSEKHMVYAHHQIAAAARLYPPREGWPRPVDWWQHAATLAPALPFPLAADLGTLLSSRHAHPNGRDDAYSAFLRACAAAPAARTAQTLGLGDVAIAALLGHLSQGAPVPSGFRLPAGVAPARVAAALREALAAAPPAESDWMPPADLCAHLLDRLRALEPVDIRFLHELGAGALAVTDIADLRALTDLLALPALDHSLLHEVLAFVPALAEASSDPDSQTYPIGGISDLARRGSLDMVVPTEWALPPELLAYRYLNAELLYYAREKPPEQQTTLLVLLIQGSDAMDGDPLVLAKAAALALAKSAGQRPRTTVQVAWFGEKLEAPQPLVTPREIAPFVRREARGGVDLAGVLLRLASYVAGWQRAYDRIVVQWLVHAQAGADEVTRVKALARRVRQQTASSALFVQAGTTPDKKPPLAEVLAGKWAALGSAALHEAEERARALRALRGLARPGEREKLLAEMEPQPPRRPWPKAEPTPPPDPARVLLDAGDWQAALEQLRPRVAQGEDAALLLLAEVPETPAVPLEMRLEAAGLLGTHDPRLLDPRTGENRLGTYWCQLEAGPFWYGPYDAPAGEQPPELQQETLPYRYQVARYAVTNAEYARFIDAEGYQQPEWWTPNGWTEREQRNWTQPRWWEDERYNAPTQPVVAVSWYEAAAYCRWLTATGHAQGWLPPAEEIRLPTSLEWERAARHTDQRPYPWGEAEVTDEHANFGKTHNRGTPVGCFPAGAAVGGALDLVGNVWEWTTTPYQQPGQAEVEKDFTSGAGVTMRGGSWFNDRTAQKCGSRSWGVAFGRDYNRGFRIIRSLRSSE